MHLGTVSTGSPGLLLTLPQPQEDCCTAQVDPRRQVEKHAPLGRRLLQKRNKRTNEQKGYLITSTGMMINVILQTIPGRMIFYNIHDDGDNDEYHDGGGKYPDDDYNGL